MSRYDADDVYCFPGTDVLRNKFDVRDAALLAQLESDFSAARLIEWTEHPATDSFDLAHLQRIHFCLFQDVYDWAGEIRTVDISRGSSRFANVRHIEAYAATLFAALKRENRLRGLAAQDLAIRLAHYLSEINALHPFREGNGRVQRAFMAQLAFEAGYLLDYSGLSQDEVYPILELAFNGHEIPLAHLIGPRLSPLA